MCLCWSHSLLVRCVTPCWRANVTRNRKYKIVYHFIFSFVSMKVEVLGAFMDDKFFFFDSQLCHKDRKLWSCDPALISFFPPMFSCRWKRTRLGLPIMRKEDRVWIIFRNARSNYEKCSLLQKKKVSKGFLLRKIFHSVVCNHSKSFKL